jgi:hypothetical protein
MIAGGEAGREAGRSNDGWTMSDDASVWEVRLGIYATASQAEEVVEQITRLLCSDSEHASSCPIPWSVTLLEHPESDDGAYGQLRDARPDRPYRAKPPSLP